MVLLWKGRCAMGLVIESFPELRCFMSFGLIRDVVRYVRFQRGRQSNLVSCFLAPHVHLRFRNVRCQAARCLQV